MPSPPLRPHFDAVYPLSPDDALDALARALAQPGCRMVGDVRKRCALIRHRPEHAHLWSPWLNVEAESVTGGTRIYGLFTPHPNVWTGFMVAYGATGFSALGFGILGAVQVSLGQSAWAVWVAAGAALAGVGAYFAAFTGQGLGAEQILEIRHFVDEVLYAQRAPDRAP
jgi:hypothetical protein